jgi:carboxypeptidase PM20D1
MKKISLIVLGLFCALVAALVIRTITFTSRQIQVQPAETFTFDRDAALSRLSQAIKFQTISSSNISQATAAELARFQTFLATAFPRAHQQLIKEVIGDHSLLFTWRGADDRLKPILLMAHMDVVPVDATTESSWRHPPFSGQIAEGFIWGRGAMDDKASVLGIFEAVENLLLAGFQPQATILLAFGHDEEVGGHNGTAKIAALLGTRKIEPAFVLDEGLNILNGIISGVTAPVALIGIAEKGYVSLKLSVQAAGGHSSIPPPDTAINTLSRAMQNLAAAPFPSHIGGAARQMLEFLGPEMTWSKKVALANLWLFEPVVRRQLASSPLTNAAIRTTMAPTIFTAGVQDNVLPTTATAVVNLRILPGETIASVTEHVRKVIDDPRVNIAPLSVQIEPSALSDTDGTSFSLLQKTIRQTVPEAVVAPALLVAATDSRHYAPLTRNVYRFLPIVLGPDDFRRYHGVDERISIADYERLIHFYAQLIRNTQP